MARSKPPAGKEIAEKAKAATLDKSKVGTGSKGGKKAKFTPAHLPNVKRIEDLEEGQAIGLLETEIEGDRAGLPAGTYNVFIAKVGDDWKVYAEANGQVVAEAASVTQRNDRPADDRPQFSEGSFCWWVWLIFTGFTWCF